MKLLIIGSNGQLGSDFIISAKDAGHNVSGVDYPDVDICDGSSLESCIGDYRPDAVINCAAFTAVDECESKRDKAFELNANACENLASASKKYAATLIHFSTDYVFDGSASTPYIEDADTNPQSVYGKSKLRGEEIITELYGDGSLIFRIAWLYGARGNNFVKTIRRIAANGATESKPVKVVNDQFGSPTWTVSVCRQVLLMLDRQECGIFHCTSEGFCSWYDFAEEIVRAAGIDVPVLPCTTDEFPRPAPRPRYSVLENARLKKIGANIMPDWREAFAQFILTEEGIGK